MSDLESGCGAMMGNLRPIGAKPQIIIPLSEYEIPFFKTEQDDVLYETENPGNSRRRGHEARWIQACPHGNSNHEVLLQATVC